MALKMLEMPCTSETQELKNFRGHVPDPLEGLGFTTGHPLSTLLDPPLVLYNAKTIIYQIKVYEISNNMRCISPMHSSKLITYLVPYN